MTTSHPETKAATRREFLAGLGGLTPGVLCANDFKGRWPQPPERIDSPFERSSVLSGIEFTGRHREYTNADTWYPSWAADGHLYSPWTDGYILDGVQEYRPFRKEHPEYACNSVDFMGRKAATAQARIEGDDPMELRIVNVGQRVDASPAPFGGRYQCGSLVHNGVWYYGTYALTQTGECGGVGWTELGPLVGFRMSTDFGKSWKETALTPAKPLFPENPAIAKVRFGSPHFVDFGRNMEHSPDGKAYLPGHGSSSGRACNSWIQGDRIYLARVNPRPDTINRFSAYEFFAGSIRGVETWSRRFRDAAPLLEWSGRLGCVTATWNAGLGRYLMCVTRGVRRGHHDTMILEASRITGPWRIAEYMRDFGPEGYFVNIPSKFIGTDGRTVWLCYSANWSAKEIDGNPFGSRYALCLQEVRLVG